MEPAAQRPVQSALQHRVYHAALLRHSQSIQAEGAMAESDLKNTTAHFDFQNKWTAPSFAVSYELLPSKHFL
jgi:hypothetical protein